MEPELNLESTLSIPPQVMSRLVGEETVILDLVSGIYFGLDGVGKRIWEVLADGNSLGQIAAVIAEEYEVDDARAKADVVEFANELLSRGLLETT
jgi:hypothetical protein